MDETRTRPADAILDALDEVDKAVQRGNLDLAALNLEHLRRELVNERERRVDERLKRREKALSEFVDGLGERFYLVLLFGIAVGALATGSYEATIGCVIFAGGYLTFVWLSGQKPPFSTNGPRRFRG